MSFAEYKAYFEVFDKLSELGINTQEKLEQLIIIVAEHKENLVEAIPHLEKLLAMEVSE